MQYGLDRTDSQNVHFRLKSGTEDLHHEAEKSPLLGRLFAADFAIEDYSRYLLQTYLFLKPLECLLSAFFPSPHLEDFPQRIKSVALATDLNTLGVQGLNQLTVCENLPKIKNECEAFGVFYVLEGSCLGGAVIRKHLSRYGFLTDEHFHFLNIYGENLGKNWRIFLDALESKAAESPQNAEVMLSSARETFQKFTAWMSLAPADADIASDRLSTFQT